MSIARHHADWLSLIEVSGPFFSLPVVQRAFPHGLDDLQPGLTTELRAAYADWQENGATTAATHAAWVQYVLQQLLGFGAELITSGQTLPPGLEAKVDTFHETLRPDFAILPPADRADRRPVILVRVHPPSQKLESPLMGAVWKASPAARMMDLLHATGLPLGLVTNGEEWQLVFAPKNESTGFASWYADLWLQEPVTLRAFQSMLGQHRFFGVANADTPAALLQASLKDQHEVTDSLGTQVRQAVELLVRDFDRLDIDSNKTLLAGLKEAEIYNASLTVMMRLVFLFCAEERGLLRLGEAFYDSHYAVSTLRQQLREIADQRGEEVLERRSDAWCRLLATFRAVHGGVAHDSMRLPAYSGTLFDPDRYPFLEGRAPGTQWRHTPSQPPQINNRVVLHLLEALQMLRTKLPGGRPAEARRLSFRSLDIEQIGHVYEGLLDHTGRRATAITLGLDGSSKAPAPLIALTALETLATSGNEALLDDLEERTGRSRAALEKALGLRAATPKAKKKAAATSEETLPLPQSAIDDHALSIACSHDPSLIARVRPFAGLMRRDSFDLLVLIRDGSLHVAPGSERRSTGTHYTPRTLTQPIVLHTLEPLVYIGPAEGWPQGEWILKTPQEILALKVCDMAMGSGAFLVQTCRYLAERLVEAWQIQEKQLPPPTASDTAFCIVLPDGSLSTGHTAERLLPAEAAERIAIARRYVADRCLYGVDINPMAVEMAKLSLWLITLQRDRPFTFLDHALKCGDSLLGVSKLEQIDNFSLRPGERQVTFATANLFRYVRAAAEKRSALEELPSNDHRQIETKNQFHAEAEAATAKVKAIADHLIAFELLGLDGEAYEDQRTATADRVQLLMQRDSDASIETGDPRSALALAATAAMKGRRAFHWAVEFPEAFGRGGFDAFVGNPPFKAGAALATLHGADWREYIVRTLGGGIRGTRGQYDLSVFFVLGAAQLLAESGICAFIVTNSFAQGDSRLVGTARLCEMGYSIIRTVSDMQWPGDAALHVSLIWLVRGSSSANRILDGESVVEISDGLSEATNSPPVERLFANRDRAFRGAMPYGVGFFLEPSEAEPLINKRPENAKVVRRYLGGEDLNTNPLQLATRYVIDFKNWRLKRDLHINSNQPVCEDFPELLSIVEQRVRPQRLELPENNSTAKHRREYWWQFSNCAGELQQALSGLVRAIGISRVTAHHALAFVSTDQVLSERLVVFSDSRAAVFSILQSGIHEIWAYRPGTTTHETRKTYFAAEAFESFAFPLDDLSGLETIGEIYHDHRGWLMARHQIGMTDTYNRFHDKREQSEDIVKLRALHVEMDQAVAAAYEWSDLDLGHGFHPTKQGERFTLSEPARRTVLDRLLALNHQRYEEEVKAGLHDKKKSKTKTGKTKVLSKPLPTDQRALPEEWRFAHDTSARYAINLVTALLSTRAEGLGWPVLRDSFAAATTPSLLVQLALPDDRAMAERWAKRWNEQATPNLLIPALREIGAGNIEVEGEGEDAVFALKDGPKPPATEDVGYDAWLALRVVRALEIPDIEYPQQDTLDAELEKFLLTV